MPASGRRRASTAPPASLRSRAEQASRGGLGSSAAGWRTVANSGRYETGNGDSSSEQERPPVALARLGRQPCRRRSFEHELRLAGSDVEHTLASWTGHGHRAAGERWQVIGDGVAGAHRSCAATASDRASDLRLRCRSRRAVGVRGGEDVEVPANERPEVTLARRARHHSWSGLVKLLDPTRCDPRFAHVGDGRRWHIPSSALRGDPGMLRGGPKFSGLEIRPRKPRFYPVTDRSPVWPSSGCDVRLTALGGIPERSKGSGCKPDGYAFPGSNPGPATYLLNLPISPFALPRSVRPGGRHSPQSAGTVAERPYPTSDAP